MFYMLYLYPHTHTNTAYKCQSVFNQITAKFVCIEMAYMKKTVFFFCVKQPFIAFNIKINVIHMLYEGMHTDMKYLLIHAFIN